jgi:phage gp45-like
MNRNSLNEMSGRVMHMAARFTLNKGNSLPMMQELAMDFMNSEGRKAVEHIQGFGMTATPMPRDEDEQQQGNQQSGASEGVGGPGEQMKGPAAEGIALFLGGQRNHPVIIAVDDRRHRPMGLKAGESAQYDDQGQMTLIRRAGLFMVSLDSEEKGKDGKTEKKERYVSMRHVEKKKQERPKLAQKPGAQRMLSVEARALAAKQEEQQQKERENHKHEGETVNTEIRTTKNRIEFRSGDDVVGYYDKSAKRWSFTGEVRLGQDDADHPVYGVNGAVGKTTKTSGVGAVLVKAPQPGPPTSEDTEP